MRKQIAAANWKMNLSTKAGKDLINKIIEGKPALQGSKEVVIAVPFPYLVMAKELTDNTERLSIAAQDCSAFDNGAYTGQVSAGMLSELKIPYVVIGHSERRQYNHETNKELANKTDKALAAGLKVIFCCGEALDCRDAGEQYGFVKKQLEESLWHLAQGSWPDILIAYEPIWAIGTGKTATTEQAQEMHAHIRDVIKNKFGDTTAQAVSILYGGSVKGSNASEIFSQPDVDGGLVGGASLVAEEFLKIIASLKS